MEILLNPKRLARSYRDARSFEVIEQMAVLSDGLQTITAFTFGRRYGLLLPLVTGRDPLGASCPPSRCRVRRTSIGGPSRGVRGRRMRCARGRHRR